VIDVALHSEGTLYGQVVDPQGNPLGRTAVSIRRHDRQIAAATSDQSGHFQMRGLRGGTYQLVAGQSAGMLRLWAPHTAPPSAQPGALVVVGDQQVLGQRGPARAYNPHRRPFRLKYWLANPLVIGGIIAAAVAIPVALHNAKSKPASP
jgi:hypothetical protein